MSVKRKGGRSGAGRPANWFSVSVFWVEGEARLRTAIEAGMNLHQAAAAIGATHPAVEAKARRLGIWPRRKPALEPASASEWVLAGYGGEEEARLSGGLQSGPDLTLQALIQHPVTGDVWVLDKTTGRMVGITRAEEQPELPAYLDPVDAAEAAAIDLTPHALILEHPDPTVSEGELGGLGESAGELEFPVGESGGGGIGADQIPSQRKRSRRPRSAKLITIAPIEAAENGTKMVIQLDAMPSPKKREWDFPAPGGCLYPFGDVGKPGFGFCAEPVAGTGIPYCQEHIRRVYGRGMARDEVD